MRCIAIAITLATGLTGATAAFAVGDPVSTTAPFAISLGITFSGNAESSLPLETLSASVATGGTTVVTNATAMVTETSSTTSANGGASTTGLLNSNVSTFGNSFESSVGTGTGYYPLP